MDNHVLPENANGVVAKDTLKNTITGRMVAMAARITGDKPLEKTGFSAGKGTGTEQATNPVTVGSPPRLLLFKRD
eukprot:14963311-Heterocapsa_arctica.AAC.1